MTQVIDDVKDTLEEKRLPSYALITAARNEAALIGQTIGAVLEQTIKPVAWIIVSDGSTDRTDEIVQSSALNFPWIQLLRMPPRTERHFGGKAVAFHTAYEQLRGVPFTIIGNLDADITFDSEYFAFLLQKFSENPKLGVAGTPFREGATQYNYRFSRREHVSGACQLFRRECFEAVGGYLPRKEGGVDLIAVVTARMKGWKTETFTEKVCIHHRPMGQAGPNLFIYSFRSGYGDYVLGVHPAWQLFRSVYQMKARPYMIVGMLLLAGYLWAMFTHAPCPVSEEFVIFRRREQMRWLKDYAKKILTRLG